MRVATTILVFCVAGLLALGMVMLYSSSMTYTGIEYPVMQVVWCSMGVVAATLVAWPDYQHLKKVSWLLFLVAVVMLVLVLIPSVGVKVKGARRWLDFGGLTFQPSEFAKVALIIGLAHYGESCKRLMPTFWRGLILPGAFVAAMLALIFKEPDWGSTILLAGVSGVMLLLAGVRLGHILPFAVLGIPLLALFIWNDPERFGRVTSWLDLEATKGEEGYQAWQAMIGLGTGGVTGLGLGDGRQKYGFLPEHHTDFIFAIIGEELGLVATLGIVVGFVAVVMCGIYIAWRARDTFGALLAAGVTFLIGCQAFINIGVVTSALPNKGLPLPFISRGGSNLFIMLVCVGLLLSIARPAGEQRRVAPQPADLDDVPVPQTA